MKLTLQSTLIALVAFTSTAFAAETGGAGGGGILVAVFLGFFAMIVVLQLVPATLMLIGMLRGLFGRDRKEVKASR